MTDATVDLADVERLAAKLDAADLDDKNRITLHAIFALAGLVVAGERDNEVSGFSFPGTPEISRGLLGSFQGARYNVTTDIPIAFSEGDPDRPILDGRNWNAR